LFDSRTTSGGNCWYSACHYIYCISAEKEKNVKNDNQKEQPGDVLGISNPGGPKLPHPPSDGSTPRGIDVRSERKRHWGNEDIPQSDGASGIDMGAGGDGPQIAPEHPRPKVEDEI
jgi:hypothetical protein